MAFESLTEKLQKVFRDIRGKGKLSEADVKAALKEVRMALLEADVGFKVVKQFIKSIESRAVGQEELLAETLELLRCAILRGPEGGHLRHTALCTLKHGIAVQLAEVGNHFVYRRFIYVAHSVVSVFLAARGKGQNHPRQQ